MVALTGKLVTLINWVNLSFFTLFFSSTAGRVILCAPSTSLHHYKFFRENMMDVNTWAMTSVALQRLQQWMLSQKCSMTEITERPSSLNGYSDGDYHMATKGVLSFVPIQWSTWCAGPVGVSFRVWGMEGGEGEKWAVQMSSNRELANLVCLWSVSVQSFRKVTSF